MTGILEDQEGLQPEDRIEASPREAARRVLLLETDERAGLVAAIALSCHQCGVSLEITTGLSHVLLTFEADGTTTDRTVSALRSIAGVGGVHPYSVLAAA